MQSISTASTFTHEDWEAYNRACVARLRRSETARGQWSRILAFVVLGVLFAPAAGAARSPLHLLSFALGASLAVGAVALNWRLVLKRAAPDPGGAFFAPHTCDLDANGIRVRRAGVDSFSDWTTVHEVTRSAEHLCLWIDRRQAFVLPLRDLPADVNRDDVLRQIEDWRSLAAAGGDEAIASGPAPATAAASASSAGTRNPFLCSEANGFGSNAGSTTGIRGENSSSIHACASPFSSSHAYTCSYPSGAKELCEYSKSQSAL